MVSAEFFDKKITDASKRENDDSSNLGGVNAIKIDQEAVFRKYVSAPLGLDHFDLIEACQTAMGL